MPQPRFPCLAQARRCAWGGTIALLLATGGALAAAPPRQACEGDFQTVLQATATTPALQAQAVWLNRQWLRWPSAPDAAAAMSPIAT